MMELCFIQKKTLYNDFFTDLERTRIGYITSDKFDEQFRNETSRIDAVKCFSAAMLIRRFRAEGCTLDHIVY